MKLTSACGKTDRHGKQKMEYRRRLDFKCQGNARAFSRIRDMTQPGVFEIQHQVQDTAITVPQEDGTLLAYCHQAMKYQYEALIRIHDTTATLIAKDEHIITLRTHGELPAMDQYEISQSNVINHPMSIMNNLQQQWDQYWNLEPERLNPPPGFQQMLNQIPETPARGLGLLRATRVVPSGQILEIKKVLGVLMQSAQMNSRCSHSWQLTNYETFCCNYLSFPLG